MNKRKASEALSSLFVLLSLSQERGHLVSHPSLLGEVSKREGLASLTWAQLSKSLPSFESKL